MTILDQLDESAVLKEENSPSASHFFMKPTENE